MRVGVPKEIKNHEYRVGLTPDNVREVVAHGHSVLMETGAGLGISAADEEYIAAGAEIAATAKDVFDNSEMIVKVKEPQAVERAMLRPDHILFTYLHLAPDPEQTADLVKSGAVCIAYETVRDTHGRLPLLAPMSQVAGRLAVQAGAAALQKANGGLGVLLGGVPGVAPAKVVVIGGGVVGAHSIAMALGLGADVTVLDRDVNVLSALSAQFGPALKTVFSTRASLEQNVLAADLVIGAVLVAGAAAPKLVTAEHVKKMKAGSVLVDVAIDQGGCFETSHATTHADPTYIVDDVVHYCVANMPGAVPRTSTEALNNATLPYVLGLADLGYEKALKTIPGFLPGLNVYKGKVTVEEVAENLGYEYVAPDVALG
ncbi:alanine dehydrogenase [Pseudovibrio exalbescens]|uniref:alanine dehydrogenase n=1 Tax=Pseudovibrio exalbescens TaxID=197461 RepID=UPI0023654843|nr:alanine dehydrogenase [Pseudovibrio exalbescens]MDD7910382.1 alanine dehydrogenase [Pseudovibrio exalbescens]